MSEQRNVAVFVLSDSRHEEAAVQRTLENLADAPDCGISVHAIWEPGRRMQGHHAIDARVPEGRQASTAQRVNDLFAQETAEVVFLLVAGTVAEPHDLRDAAMSLSEHPDGLTVGRTFDVHTPRGQRANSARLWRKLRRGDVGNRVDVTANPEAISLIGMSRSAYVGLRGLDESIRESGEALEDLLARARHAGILVHGGPIVFRPSAPINALPDRSNHTRIGASRLAGLPIYRNLRRSVGNPDLDPPLVSIVISTFNRAEYLPDCLNSILAQSMPDFEVILVDDGSTDNTAEVVRNFDDRRIRYFARPNEGISAARNYGLEQARGVFVAVHDDDDIMLPWRLATQLRMLQPGDHGSFGVSVHFDEETGETYNLVHRLFNMQTALAYGNNPTHPTWLLRRDVMASFGYDETLESGVDNNVALRMVRSGVRLRHCGVPLILRRVHHGQITRTAGETQKASAHMSRRLLQFANANEAVIGAESEWLPQSQVDNRVQRVLPYLPDDLVSRAVTVHLDRPLSESLAAVRHIGTVQFQRARFGGEELAPVSVLTLQDVTWAGLAALRKLGADFEAAVLQLDAGSAATFDRALEAWSVDQLAAAEHAPNVCVRIVTTRRAKLEQFLASSTHKGWSYTSQRDDMPVVALVEAQDLAFAVAISGDLEKAGFVSSELSILGSGEIGEDVVCAALMSGDEVRA